MKKVLVVDDQETDRMMMMNILKDAGCKSEFMQAADGDDAIEKLGSNHDSIGLILCDWRMPKLSGIDFIKAFGQIPTLHKIPLVMVTTVSEEEKIDEAFAAYPKLAGYIKKTVEPALFREQILKCVRRHYPDSLDEAAA